ncbi:sn-glycerol-1-phosphate dehydrogenase [Pullulanibacillus camelliae]|nr:sn-glycerol-1-phosphate dehydrogenase [Pullulanibacillus camelliae]
MLAKFKALSKQINGQDIGVERVVIESNALSKIPKYIQEKGFEKIAIIADANTFEAAGKRLSERFTQEALSYYCHLLTMDQHQQVVANEETLVELFLAIDDATDVLIAVGSGTIHDIVRFVSDKMAKPFLSVPTAASVDGFTSKGAPLILRGSKQTVQAASPLALFADLRVLAEAPAEMTAAGFGDILGKYTSLVDWKISHLIGKEPYYQKAAEMTNRSLQACVEHVHEIAARDERGIKRLMQALIESGLVMLVLDYSRPASGAEHHLSHYWEMALLRQNKRQLLHGAKVGVATTLIVDLYKKQCKRLERERLQKLPVHGEALYEHWPAIVDFIERLPDKEYLQALLKTMGGPGSTKELGLEPALIQASLQEAHHLRARCTGLFLINENKHYEQ